MDAHQRTLAKIIKGITRQNQVEIQRSAIRQKAADNERQSKTIVVVSSRFHVVE